MDPLELKKQEEDALLLKVNAEASKAAKAAFDTLKSDYEEIARKASEGLYSKKEVDEKLTVISDSVKDFDPEKLTEFKTALDEINETIKEQGRQINKFTTPAKNTVRKGFGDIVKQLLIDADMIEEYVVDSKISDRKASRIKNYDTATKGGNAIDLKVAIDMTSPLTLAPGSDPGVNIGFLTDYNMMDVLVNLTKDTHVVNFLPTDPITGQYMGVLIETTYFDGAETKLEADASAKSSLKFITKEFKVFTIATHFRVSLEMLADVDRLASKLNRIAPDKIMSQLDEKVLSDDGNNSTDIEGMYVAGNFTEFDPTVYQDEIVNANIQDLVQKMKLQATLADEDVNAVVLHPSLVDSVEGYKDADSNFLKSRGIVFDDNGNLVRIRGLAVIRNKKNGTNAATVLWNEASEIGIREDVNFEIGTDGNDLTEGMRTIVFRMRAAFGVGKPAAIIYEDDVTGAIAILNKDDA